ncbi:hypothetical protein D3C84_614630 [compost metagenome]
MVGEGAPLALEFVGQEAVRVHLAGGHAELRHRPVEEILAVGRHGGGHHRPGGPVGVIVDLLERQVAPVPHRLLGQPGEPRLDQLALPGIGRKGPRARELQPQPGPGQAAQGPFAHRLAGVVEVGGEQGVGLGPVAEPLQGALQALGLAVAHVAHHLFVDAALEVVDRPGLRAEFLFGFAIERGARLVRTLVLAAEHQGIGIGLGRRQRAALRVALAVPLDRGVIAGRRHQPGTLRDTAGEQGASQEAGQQAQGAHHAILRARSEPSAVPVRRSGCAGIP